MLGGMPCTEVHIKLLTSGTTPPHNGSIAAARPLQHRCVASTGRRGADYTLRDRPANRSNYRMSHIIGSSLEHREGIHNGTTQLGVLHNFTTTETNGDVGVLQSDTCNTRADAFVTNGYPGLINV